MNENTIYTFTDIAAENYLVIGPGGISFTPIGTELAAMERFEVRGEIKAQDFSVWIANDFGIHTNLVAP